MYLLLTTRWPQRSVTQTHLQQLQFWTPAQYCLHPGSEWCKWRPAFVRCQKGSRESLVPQQWIFPLESLHAKPTALCNPCRTVHHRCTRFVCLLPHSLAQSGLWSHIQLQEKFMSNIRSYVFDLLKHNSLKVRYVHLIMWFIWYLRWQDKQSSLDFMGTIRKYLT